MSSYVTFCHIIPKISIANNMGAITHSDTGKLAREELAIKTGKSMLKLLFARVFK